jgi:flagellin-like protein
MVKKVARRAVSPVLATLMMVAVAVALSVIIFTWSQGFLSQTGEAAQSGQQAQNIAAQSGILIESVTFTTNNDNVPDDSMTILIRNVGSVTVEPALAIATGRPTNSGFTGSATTTTFTPSSLPKGGSATATISSVLIKSGDVITVKVTTTAGTFAQATYIVP